MLKENKGKRMKNTEESLWDWGSTKKPNIRKIRVPEGGDRDMGQKFYLQK